MEILNWLDPRHIIEALGPYGFLAYVALALIIFAESGLFFGFFLPGDSLLLTAGLTAYEGGLNIWVLLPLLFAAAVLGDNVGYWFGKKTGPPLFQREESLLFRPKNLEAARKFYEKEGGKAIIIARFMPFIRTFAPIVAGAVQMPYSKFFTYNIVGGGLWAIGMTLAGYFLGRMFTPEALDKWFLVIIAVVILLSVSPTIWHLLQDRKRH